MTRDGEPIVTWTPSPAELWQQAGGDPQKYRDLLAEHGHLLRPGDDGYDEAVAKLPCQGPG